MKKFIIIDGNSILNRAFYGIMGGKMLQTADGTYTNAVYGFLAIYFKTIEDVNPDYVAVAFDMKKPTKRHEMYSDYKGTRKGMPEELVVQMPIIKDVLKSMNISIVEEEGYEADDILGTLSKAAEKNNIEAILLTGDRDSFQLASNHISIRMPRTKNGKTETEIFDRNKIKEVYGLEPKSLIEVKGLQGDTSDNIPGVPGIGEKTAIKLIQEFGTIDNIYKKIENGEKVAKGKLEENLENNKNLAILSKTLGTIMLNAPIDTNIDHYKKQEWNKPEVLELFKKLKFNRYIERFDLQNTTVEPKEAQQDLKDLFKTKAIDKKDEVLNLIDKIKNDKVVYYYLEKEYAGDLSLIINKKFKNIYVYIEGENIVYCAPFDKDVWKDIFEDKEILKCTHKIKMDYVILKQIGINPENMMYDAEIAAYLLNSVTNAYAIEDIASVYLDMDIGDYKDDNKQESLFDEVDDTSSKKYSMYAYIIFKSKKILEDKLESINSLKLFNEVEMPLASILAEMQYIGMYVDLKELVKYGNNLKKHIEELRIDIFRLSGEEFNINSTKQLAEVLYEKLKLTPTKKTKNGYSTDVAALEKIKDEHPIIEKLLDYRQIMKLNSTYVEGMLNYINEKTGRVHTYFHQTITATGRLSSSDPNLQNIPTRYELGKKLRKVFKPEKGRIFLDSDYSQIELRILAHMADDKEMIAAFNSNEDIHTITASQVFNVPVENVSKQLRSKAKAVNFGIVYGISEFGLAEQINIRRDEARQYIEKYLETYHGIKDYMTDIVESAKNKGYVETLYHRRRYIPELSSKNYMIRKFGERAAMNTTIQGTAADIMKIAMIKVYNELKKRNLKSKIVLQIHDELLIETEMDEKEEVKSILKECMENVCNLSVPLYIETEEGKNWYQAK